MFRAIATSFLGGGTIPLLVIVAIIGAFATGYFNGRIDASQNAKIEKLETVRDQLIADRDRLSVQLRIARQAIADVNRQSELDARTMGALKGKVDDYERQLSTENACILSPTDADFLRNIK